jgi:hypothetical protein
MDQDDDEDDDIIIDDGQRGGGGEATHSAGSSSVEEESEQRRRRRKIDLGTNSKFDQLSSQMGQNGNGGGGASGGGNGVPEMSEDDMMARAIEESLRVSKLGGETSASENGAGEGSNTAKVSPS